ncbi:MAG: hypothetical protein KC422_18895 [Trueperaceae bacterium]|nr:hypothetical protein [Trueperaceae bacterium]
MFKSQKQSLILFIALTLAGFILAGLIAPAFAGHSQMLLLATGMSLFGSGLTSFIIRFLGEKT